MTDKSRRDVEKTALDLKKQAVEIDEIWHSPKLRAQQSAEIVSQILRIDKVIEKDGLKPKDPVDPIASLIRQSDKTLLIAGHLPYLAKLASLLKTGSEDKEVATFRQGIAVKLEIREPLSELSTI